MLSHVLTNTPTHVLWGTLHHFQGLMKYFHWTAVPYITHTLQVTEKVCFKNRRWVVYWNWTGVYSSACKQTRLLSTSSHRGLKPLTDTSQEARGSSFKANGFWGFWWCGKARKAWMEKSNTWDAAWNHVLHAKVSWDCHAHLYPNDGLQVTLFTHPNKQRLWRKKTLYLPGESPSSSGIPFGAVHKHTS